MTKYKAAAEVANFAMTTIINAVKVGAKVIDLCKLGDTTIDQQMATVKKILFSFSKKKCAHIFF